MEVVAWLKKWGVVGDQVVELEAYEAEGKVWVVKRGCFRDVVPGELLSDSREAALERLAKLGPMREEMR